MTTELKPEPFHRGKVRDTYELEDPDCLLVVASDRLSIFDVVLGEHVPGKGEILTRLTKFWLTHPSITSIIPNHFVTTDPARLPPWAGADAGRAMMVRRAEMLPIECIVRGYLCGSAWREYQSHGTMHGQVLPRGLNYLDPLPEPVFTPSTKALVGEHDLNLSVEQAIDLVGSVTTAALRTASLALYQAATAVAYERGIMVVDTKFEFGMVDGQLTLCDEVLTPDSSRFLAVAGFDPTAPRWLDKEYVRQWGIGTGWDKVSAPPVVPAAVIYEAAQRYTEVYHRLTDSL